MQDRLDAIGCVPRALRCTSSVLTFVAPPCSLLQRNAMGSSAATEGWWCVRTCHEMPGTRVATSKRRLLPTTICWLDVCREVCVRVCVCVCLHSQATSFVSAVRGSVDGPLWIAHVPPSSLSSCATNAGALLVAPVALPALWCVCSGTAAATAAQLPHNNCSL